MKQFLIFLLITLIAQTIIPTNLLLAKNQKQAPSSFKQNEKKVQTQRIVKFAGLRLQGELKKPELSYMDTEDSSFSHQQSQLPSHFNEKMIEEISGL